MKDGRKVPGLCVVVASYLGDRRGGLSGYELLEEQIRLLGQLQSPRLDQVYIVVSGDFNFERLASIKAEAKQYQKIHFLHRENSGFSYGAWDHAVKHLILNLGYEGDFFLIEDDYCIISPDFAEAFYDVGRYGYICQLVFDDPVRHPAAPHGLLDGALARALLLETGDLFQLDGGSHLDRYHVGEHIQMHFLDSVESFCNRNGVPFLSDVSATTRILYYCQIIRAVKYYGHPDRPAYILPYEYLKARHGPFAPNN